MPASDLLSQRLHHQKLTNTDLRTAGRRGAMPGRRAGPGFPGRQVGVEHACPRRPAGSRRRAGVQRRRHSSHPRPAADLALRVPGRHPLDAEAERAARARRQRLLLPSSRSRREGLCAQLRPVPERPRPRPLPDAHRTGRPPQARQDSRRRVEARVRRDARRARRHHLQRSAPRQAVHLWAARRARAAAQAPTSAATKRWPNWPGATSAATGRPPCATSSGGRA